MAFLRLKHFKELHETSVCMDVLASFLFGCDSLLLPFA